MAQKSVTIKSALLGVVQVLVFASLVSTQRCRTGICVEQKYCLERRVNATRSAKCKMQSNGQGVCCGMSNITLGKNCVFTFKTKKFSGKCVPESSCVPYGGKNVWKTSNNTCSEVPSKNFFCCPENLLKELDSSKLIDRVKIVRGNRPRESQTLVPNVFPSCRTPDLRFGHCVPLQLCDHLNDLLRNALHQANRNNTLNRYKCPSNAIESTAICCANPTNSSSFILHRKATKLGFAKCGPVSIENKILAGEKAGLGQYPWMANLMYKLNKTHLEPKCGGSLIHPKYVLTAAHCRQRHKFPVAVRLGEYDLSKRIDCEEGECAELFKEYSVDKFTTHYKYRLRSRDYDIALIRLTTEVTLVPGQIFPICLPLTASLLMLKPNKLTVTGWGLTESGKTSDVLLKAYLVHVNSDLDECRRESTFCARGTEMQGNCKGDSGGPLQTIVPFENTYRTVLFGTVVGSFRKCSAKANIPGVAVLVGYHIHWILDNMDI